LGHFKQLKLTQPSLPKFGQKVSMFLCEKLPNESEHVKVNFAHRTQQSREIANFCFCEGFIIRETKAFASVNHGQAELRTARIFFQSQIEHKQAGTVAFVKIAR